MTQREQVLALAKTMLQPDNRVDCHALADALGLDLMCVKNHVARLRKKGELPHFKRKSPKGRLARATFDERDIKVGPMQDLLGGLPPAIIKWLAGEIPDGSSVAEFAAALIRDAYYEEME